MQKTKSLSLSQKDRGKIITIIHSKITPLKFKHNPFQKERQYMISRSLPKLTYQHQKINVPFKKRFSISTCIEKSSPKSRQQRSKLQMDFRNEILNTQNLVEQQEFLKLSQTCQNFHKSNQTPFSEFYKHQDPFPVKKNQKILSDFQILQKKKKLKVIKSEIDLKKNKLFDQIQNKKLQKRQEQLLHKKYTQNSKQILKERFSHQKYSSQFLSLMHIEDPHHKSSDNRISIGSIDENNQKTKNNFLEIDQMKPSQKQEAKNLYENDTEIILEKENKIKDFLGYFKKADSSSRPNSSKDSLGQQNEGINGNISEKDKAMNYQPDTSNDNLSTPLYNKSQCFNPTIFAQDNMIFRGLSRMLQQKMKQTNDENKNEIINAKMRIRFNHKKIVNLGKTQKFSRFRINANENNLMFQN